MEEIKNLFKVISNGYRIRKWLYQPSEARQILDNLDLLKVKLEKERIEDPRTLLHSIGMYDFNTVYSLINTKNPAYIAIKNEFVGKILVDDNVDEVLNKVINKK